MRAARRPRVKSMNKKFTRRDFGKLAGAGIPLATMALKSPNLFAGEKPDSKIAGVQLGAQTYSFRDFTGVDPVIAALVTVGLSSCELFAPHVEIAGATYNSGGASRGSNSAAAGATPSARENLRQWRLNAPMSYFEGVRKKFTDAGIDIYAYNYSFAADFTDDEIDQWLCDDQSSRREVHHQLFHAYSGTARRSFSLPININPAWPGTAIPARTPTKSRPPKASSQRWASRNISGRISISAITWHGEAIRSPSLKNITLASPTSTSRTAKRTTAPTWSGAKATRPSATSSNS